MVETIRWVGDWSGHLELIDQTLLPGRLELLTCRNADDVWQAIKRLQVRGAPAIGIAAAYGVVVELARHPISGSGELRTRVHQICNHLAGSRPTAVNLFWALARIRRAVDEYLRLPNPVHGELCQWLWGEAVAIHEDDRALCRPLGMPGAALLE
ncbi:MAG TPA: S-methyl-5-thioribose-1-phosphate isomerase, partial [Pirellulaceae bacterium]|nr:S-methyl-5-thioribose-1-phosphate isomerase [Pirellulaceae bacterium]